MMNHHRKGRGPPSRRPGPKPGLETALEIKGGVVYVRPPVTYRELGEWMGVSKQRVRQIEMAALAKLQRLISEDREQLEKLREALA